MRPFRFALLASAAVVFAACSDGVVAPDGRSIDRGPSPFFSTGTTTETDSVQAGYGCPATGGLEYECFEYEPCTGTEYVVCPDTTVNDDPEFIGPPAPPKTGSTSGGSTGGTTAPQDSVTSGYGNESTGGIDYDRFEYDPETGTEPVVTPDPDGGN